MITLSQGGNQSVDILSFRRCNGPKAIIFDREFRRLRLDLSSPEALGGDPSALTASAFFSMVKHDLRT